jgi:hypothetical protein
VNSIIARLFVFVNEVLSLFVILANLIIGLSIMGSVSLLWGLAYLSISTLFLIVLFGISAIFIESYKTLVQIRDSLDKPLSSLASGSVGRDVDGSHPAEGDKCKAPDEPNATCPNCNKPLRHDDLKCWSCNAEFTSPGGWRPKR